MILGCASNECRAIQRGAGGMDRLPVRSRDGPVVAERIPPESAWKSAHLAAIGFTVGRITFGRWRSSRLGYKFESHWSVS